MKKAILLTVMLALTARGDDFAFKLYGQLRTAEGNLFFSPASIESALAMTREGAAGNTLRQMSLLLPEASAFPNTGTNVTLESANAIWVDKQFPILAKFQSAVQGKYGAEIRPADFAGQPEIERGTVNRWVEEKTRDKIKNLLAPGSVTPDTRLILVNAIYFKGDWLHAFEKAKTEDEPFWMTPEVSTNVPMMTMKPERFSYTETESFQCLELPYQGEDVSMLIILPKEKDGLARIEDGLSSDALADWTGTFRKEEIEIHLPRFKIESQFDSMAKTLAALGLTDAFNPALADFSGISARPLFISDVVHKAFVQVDEEGTEAAAATGVAMCATALPMSPKVFRADHPFLFLIRHNASGTILFMGRVFCPAE
ncbi:MAG TPA: serpin family protein [Pontiellaceae bacterium]|nr:serpin family protein [Pontiellaceae bacterium]